MNKNFFRHQVIEAFKQILLILLCILIAAVLSFLFPACTTQRNVQEVPVEVPMYIHDTLRITVKEKETILVTDSTIQRGDTVHHYRDRWREHILHDTIYQVRRDTIGMPVAVTNTVTIEKEKPLSWWQSGLMCVGLVTIAFLLAWAVLLALRAKLSGEA